MIAGGGRVIQSAGAASLAQSGAPEALTNNLGATQWMLAPFVPPQAPGTISAVSTLIFPPASVGVGSQTIQIGRFELQITGNAGETAELSARALAANGNSTPVQTTLDTDITQFGTLEFTIAATPVPEPSTFAALGLGLVGFGVYRRRMKRNTN